MIPTKDPPTRTKRIVVAGAVVPATSKRIRRLPGWPLTCGTLKGAKWLIIGAAEWLLSLMKSV